MHEIQRPARIRLCLGLDRRPRADSSSSRPTLAHRQSFLAVAPSLALGETGSGSSYDRRRRRNRPVWGRVSLRAAAQRFRAPRERDKRETSILPQLKGSEGCVSGVAESTCLLSRRAISFTPIGLLLPPTTSSRFNERCTVVASPGARSRDRRGNLCQTHIND